MTELVKATRNLPMPMVSEIERLGYALLRGLDRLGFVHESRDGSTFSVSFSDARLYGSTWAAYFVDCERLYRFSVADLAKPSVLSQLSAVVHKPVRIYRNGGLAFVVELNARPKTRLPDRVNLDLSQKPAGELLVPLGVGRNGPVWANLHKVGHALIVGASGSGKSVWLHSALAALLSSAGPDVLRLALLDPKRNELTAWGKVPHLVAPIACTEGEATALLSELVAEIDRRGELMAGALVRDLGAYNRQAAAPLPYILCVIDECLDLVLSAGSGSAVVSYLKTLAVRGRSAGVILWAATQHAAAVVGLPRVVNVNLSARLAFRVTDRQAAESAGCIGADRLPRDVPGRLLAKIDGEPVELQGYYLDDDALTKISKSIAGNAAPGPTLTETERELLAFALLENGGVLTLSDIRARARGPNEAKRIALNFERRGWLTKDPQGKNRRTLTDQGRVIAGNAVKLSNTSNTENSTDGPSNWRQTGGA